MKQNLIPITGFAILVFIGALSGCGGHKPTGLVNTLTFDTGNFQNLRLDYDADDILVFESDDDKVVVKEYMNEDKKSYHARTTAQKDGLLVTEGERPGRRSFESYIELYIPYAFTGNLSLHSTSGTIKSGIPLNLSGEFTIDTTRGVIEVSNTKASVIRLASTNGNVRLENIDADEIEIQTTNATTSINKVRGVISYSSKGGELNASGVIGSGGFSASGEGSITISFSDVTDNIFAYSKNGTLAVGLPSQLAFIFSATTKEGFIDIPFADQIVVTDNVAYGIVGTSPEISIELETQNGDIKVTR